MKRTKKFGDPLIIAGRLSQLSINRYQSRSKAAAFFDIPQTTFNAYCSGKALVPEPELWMIAAKANIPIRYLIDPSVDINFRSVPKDPAEFMRDFRTHYITESDPDELVNLELAGRAIWKKNWPQVLAWIQAKDSV